MISDEGYEHYDDEFANSADCLDEKNHQFDDRCVDQVMSEHPPQVDTARIQTRQHEVDELTKRLSIEQRAHDKTKNSLLLELESHEKTKAALSNMNEFLSQPPPLPMDLRSEFLKFSSRHSIPNQVIDVNEMTAEAGISILKSATKLITSQLSDAPITGTDSELATRIRNLEQELRLALGAAEDIRALKAKVLNMVERLRVEKDSKNKAESEVQICRKKMEILGDHMEKLMSNLRHEAAAKIRTVEANRLSERNVQKFKEKCDMLNRKCQVKDRLIFEIREGSKILEDQLMLMDEKYLVLRSKLDWARENGMKRVKQAEKTASELRMKFMLSGNGELLDNVFLPEINCGSIDSDQVTAESNNSSRLLSSRRSLTSSRQRLATSRSTKSANGFDVANREPTLEYVQEKLRKKQGLQKEWTDEKLRDLSKTR